jgi:hypothetical protein
MIAHGKPMREFFFASRANAEWCLSRAWQFIGRVNEAEVTVR